MIAIGADHAGYELKVVIANYLRDCGHDVLDCGAHDAQRVDYPDYGAAVGRAVVAGQAQLGVCICGSGIGICIAANKIVGVRAATLHDVTSARLSRQHNDANIACFGARLLGPQTVLDSVDAFLGATFEGGRHQQRVEKIDALLVAAE